MDPFASLPRKAGRGALLVQREPATVHRVPATVHEQLTHIAMQLSLCTANLPPGGEHVKDADCLPPMQLGTNTLQEQREPVTCRASQLVQTTEHAPLCTELLPHCPSATATVHHEFATMPRVPDTVKWAPDRLKREYDTDHAHLLMPAENLLYKAEESILETMHKAAAGCGVVLGLCGMPHVPVVIHIFFV